jgi:Phosphate-induced protein 1 conserved region
MLLSLLFTVAFGLPSPTRTYSINEPVQTPLVPMIFSGGEVMTTVKTFNIFYGDFKQSTKSGIKKFLGGLSESDYWKVVQEYTGKTTRLDDKITWEAGYTDNYSQGKVLDRYSMRKIITRAISINSWRSDANAVYVVYISKDVSEKSLSGSHCTDYCGYHGLTGPKSNLKFSMVGDPTRCPGTLPAPGQEMGSPGCLQRYFRNNTDPSFSINRDQSLDGMVDILTHELAETATDYDNTWRDSDGEENADRCSPFIIDAHISPDGYDQTFNVDFGENGRYLLQSMSSLKTQTCVMKPDEEISIFL